MARPAQQDKKYKEMTLYVKVFSEAASMLFNNILKDTLNNVLSAVSLVGNVWNVINEVRNRNFRESYRINSTIMLYSM